MAVILSQHFITLTLSSVISVKKSTVSPIIVPLKAFYFSVLEFPCMIFHGFQISGEIFYFLKYAFVNPFSDDSSIWITCGSVSIACFYFSSLGWPTVSVS